MGGVIAIPGIPTFLGGCDSPDLIRDVWDMLGWLKHIGELKLWRGWYELVGSLVGKKGQAGLQAPRCTKPRLPENLHTFPERSWASPGAETLFNKAPPVLPELEKRIVTGLLSDLNTNFDLGLDTDPDLARCKKTGGSTLTIGSSHASRVSTERLHCTARVQTRLASKQTSSDGDCAKSRGGSNPAG